MAEEVLYSSVGGESNKRKYEDSPSPVGRRATGFSSPPDSAAPPPTYNSVPPPMNEIELAKQKAQEIAARLLNNADPSKRARVENGGGGTGGFDSSDYGSQKPLGLGLSGPPQVPSSGYPGPSKKIEIPNGRVGVIIGKGGETIKYLQLQSGAKIQVTRDMDADPNSATRGVELMGTPDQIAKAEQLINDVLSEAEAGGSGIVSRRLTGQPSGAEQFVMKIPNNKVGLVIGKGGETIKNMQARTGARIQVIPLHLPPGDMSKERTVQIDGTSEQIEAAKQLVEEVISEKLACLGTVGIAPICWTDFRVLNSRSLCSTELLFHILLAIFDATSSSDGLSGKRILLLGFSAFTERMGFCRSNPIIRPNLNAYVALTCVCNMFSSCIKMDNRMRNPSMSGGYPQQGYQARPPTNWGQPGPPMQQPGYGYTQPGAYPGPSPQYNMNQPSYSGYPPQPTSGGYATGWDQSTAPQNQQTAQGGGYDYYNQQQPPQQQQAHGGSGAPTDGSGYGYGQAPAYSQGQGYGQDGYGGYHAGAAQSGYGQTQPNPASGYDQQQQGYSSTYGNVSNPTPDGHTTSYGTQGEANQAPAPGQSYNAGGQPVPNPNYPPQASNQTGYGVPPSSQGGYGTQTSAGYGSYGPPQAQKPPTTQPVYAQPQQSPSAQAGGYTQPGYPHSQAPAAQTGYAQTDSGSQRPPTSGYPTSQPGYAAPPYGAPPATQASYGQQQPSAYNSSYAAGYSQPPAYSSDGSASGNPRGTYDTTPPPQSAQPSGAAKASPPS
ncbi:Far upstream element-binding protein 2 [Sesamum angolense]|uniref:Far upstream element-binding protein 2 n=1 Tax=Sesamum angolense TaxID=2727404 RepID=A0AAE1WWY4_9LAMI|nr:Far upstream element-binding protein 2 [Sesamum angolense]